MAKRGTPTAGNPLMINTKDWNRPLVMQIFCDRLRTSSLSNRRCLEEPWQGYPLPDFGTVRLWMIDDPAIMKMYDEAKQGQLAYMAEELMDIADNGSNDLMERLGKEGQVLPGYQLNGEHVQRSKLRVETRKWLLTKLMPDRFGEKQETKVTGEVTVNISKEDAKVL